MKKTGRKVVSMLLAGSMTLCSAAASMTVVDVYAGAVKTAQKSTQEKGIEKAKYISDVFISYGKTESEAVKWLTDNGWEPIGGNRDFNAGKNSSNGKEVAAVMGIKRTDDPKKAITDMAMMNMSGGYDFPAYEEILDEKRDEIDDFINSFLPAIEEFRANFNGEGSDLGQKRAEFAYELLNKFYDGGTEEKYRRNDTGLPLGELFLEPLLQEGAGEGSGDLEQIILEGSGPAVRAVETALALAADTSGDSWLDRLSFLTMDELMENVETYVPAAAGQDVAPSAALNYLMAEYGDTADTLADQWNDVHETIRWYEEFRDSHDLDMRDDESDEEYSARYDRVMEELQAGEKKNPGVLKKYMGALVLKGSLDMAAYKGEWGETLGDFFDPDGEKAYAGDTESFLPMAVALSEGQRCALDFLPLETLLKVSISDEEGQKDYFPDAEEILEGCKSISVYSGVNRGIFRDGVALTSKALMEDCKGEEPAICYESNGAYNALCISAIVAGAVLVAAGGYVIIRTVKLAAGNDQNVKTRLSNEWESQKKRPFAELYKELENYDDKVKKMEDDQGQLIDKRLKGQISEEDFRKQYNAIRDERERLEMIKEHRRINEELEEGSGSISIDEENMGEKAHYNRKLGIGFVIAGIGAAFLIAGIVAKICETHDAYVVYHNKDFTKIPTMIVDVDDIVTYVENEDGEKERCIELDQYAYYEAVRCNRQDVGELSKWQKGVSDYKKQGCGDVADLNADHGLEWLALYTVKAAPEGDAPILAESLKLAFGEKNKPDLDKPSLHFFGNKGRVDLADRAYCYSNNKGKMYFSWSVEKAA